MVASSSGPASLTGALPEEGDADTAAVLVVASPLRRPSLGREPWTIAGGAVGGVALGWHPTKSGLHAAGQGKGGPLPAQPEHGRAGAPALCEGQDSCQGVGEHEVSLTKGADATKQMPQSPALEHHLLLRPPPRHRQDTRPVAAPNRRRHHRGHLRAVVARSLWRL